MYIFLIQSQTQKTLSQLHFLCFKWKLNSKRCRFKTHNHLLPDGTGDGACVGAGGIDEDGTGGIADGDGEYSEGDGGNSEGEGGYIEGDGGYSEGEGGYIEGDGGIDDGDGDSLHSTGSVPEAKQYCLSGSSNLYKRDIPWICWYKDQIVNKPDIDAVLETPIPRCHPSIFIPKDIIHTSNILLKTTRFNCSTSSMAKSS